MNTPPPPCRLSELVPGEQGLVVEVRGQGEVHRRLLDMGIVRGAPVILVKVAPLGDPIECYVKGFYMSLRKAEADTVMIQKRC